MEPRHSDTFHLASEQPFTLSTLYAELIDVHKRLSPPPRIGTRRAEIAGRGGCDELCEQNSSAGRCQTAAKTRKCQLQSRRSSLALLFLSSESILLDDASGVKFTRIWVDRFAVVGGCRGIDVLARTAVGLVGLRIAKTCCVAQFLAGRHGSHVATWILSTVVCPGRESLSRKHALPFTADLPSRMFYTVTRVSPMPKFKGLTSAMRGSYRPCRDDFFWNGPQ